MVRRGLILPPSCTRADLSDRPVSELFPVSETVRNRDDKVFVAMGVVYECTGFPVDIFDQIKGDTGMTIPCHRLSLPVPWATGLGEWSSRVYEISKDDAEKLWVYLSGLRLTSPGQRQAWSLYGVSTTVITSVSNSIDLVAVLLERDDCHIGIVESPRGDDIRVIKSRRVRHG